MGFEVADMKKILVFLLFPAVFQIFAGDVGTVETFPETVNKPVETFPETSQSETFQSETSQSETSQSETSQPETPRNETKKSEITWKFYSKNKVNLFYALLVQVLFADSKKFVFHKQRA